jgi:prophage regulatory protein
MILDKKILRCKDLQIRLGISKSTIYDKINPHSPRYDKTFPCPFKLGSTSVGWSDAEIDQWIKTRMTARPK